MKKYLLPLLLIVGLSVLLFGATELAVAQNDVVTDELCRSDAVSCDNTFFGEGGLILGITEILIRVVAGVAVVVIVVAGLMYIVSGGDSNNVQRAKNALLYAIVGLVVALAAQGIVSFVLSREIL